MSEEKTREGRLFFSKHLLTYLSKVGTYLLLPMKLKLFDLEVEKVTLDKLSTYEKKYV